MNIQNKIIAAAGKYIDSLGENEYQINQPIVCPIFGYQPMRPQRLDKQEENEE